MFSGTTIRMDRFCSKAVGQDDINVGRRLRRPVRLHIQRRRARAYLARLRRCAIVAAGITALPLLPLASDGGSSVGTRDTPAPTPPFGLVLGNRNRFEGEIPVGPTENE
jgi:hypothetical protein